MVAPERSWIPMLPTSSTVVAFVLLVLLAGWPLQGLSAEPVADSKSPTAKECRQHVEKALDQYFDSKDKATPGDQGTTKREETPPQLRPSISTDDDGDDDSDDDDDPPVSEKIQADEGDDDDDDDEEDEDEEEDDDDDEQTEEKHKGVSKEDDGKATDDEEEDDDDDEDEDEDEEDDDEEDDDETELPSKSDELSSKGKSTHIETMKDEDDDEDEEEKEHESKDDDDEDEDKEDEQGNADDDEDDEEDEEDEDEGSEDTSPISKENLTVTSTFNRTEKKESVLEHEKETKSEQDVEGDDDDEEEEDEDEDDEDEENEEGEEEGDEKKGDTDEADEDEDEADGDDDDDDDEDESDETSDTPKTPPIPDKPIPQEPPKKTEAESLKVTGASDSVATGMAQEFPRTQPISQQPKAEKDTKKASEVLKETPVEGNVSEPKMERKIEVEDEEDDDDEEDEEEDDDDAIENIYEEEDDTDDVTPGTSFRSRDHIDAILGLDEIGTGYDHEEDKLAQTIFRDIKKIHATSIKPMEILYKFTDSTTRLLGDAEIFGKPMILFLGPWNTGKTTIINYLLGTERTPSALKTGTGITDVDFTVITYGDQRQTISGTELAADWRYASLQRFGQGFLDHFKSVTMPHTLLKKISLVDTPGILESRKNTDRGYSFNDAFQWFIDRADAIYVTLDPNKVDIGAELGAVLDQLKGRDVRFILNKADTIRRSDLMKVVGQLFWNLSPLMSGTEAPLIYAVSLSTKPFNPTAPAKFLSDQEKNFLYDLKDTMDKRVENRILYARRHAVRVRNHAKMVDCYLATYYKTKSIFSNKKNVAKLITENPTDYQIYEGLSSMTNVSRYDIPDPKTYKNFFKMHLLYDFKPLASTCSYFRGCPMDKLDNAIANELPELFAKYKKAKNDSPQPAVKKDGR